MVCLSEEPQNDVFLLSDAWFRVALDRVQAVAVAEKMSEHRIVSLVDILDFGQVVSVISTYSTVRLAPILYES